MRLGKVRSLVHHIGHQEQGTGEEVLAIFGKIL
jgi:hypothetical protein